MNKYLLKIIFRISKAHIRMMYTATSLLELNTYRSIALEHINYFYMHMTNSCYNWFNDLIERTYYYNYRKFDATYKEFLY